MALRTVLVPVGRRKRLAFGLGWHVPPGLANIRKEARVLVKAQSPSHLLTVRPDKGRALIGLTLGLKRGTRAHSAAVLFAGYVQQSAAILIWRLDDERVAMIGVREGGPVVGFDVVTHAEGADNLVEEFRLLIGEEVPVYGNAALLDGTILLDLNELFEQAKDVVLCARLLPATLPVLLILLASLLLVGGAAGLWGLHAWQEAQRKKALQAQQVDPLLLYRQNLPGALLMAGTRVEVLPKMLEGIYRLPVVHEGWRMTGIRCQVSMCSATWGREFGSYQSFKANPVPGAANIQYSPDFKQISTDFVILAGSAAEVPAGVKESALLNEQEFMLALGTMAQTLQGSGVSLSMQGAKIYGLPPGVAEGAVRNPVKQGMWKLSGKLWSDRLPLDLPAGSTLDALSISVPETQGTEAATISLEGKFYVKS